MNSKLLRGILNALACQLIVAWAIALFWTDRANWLAAWAMCIFIITGYMAFCDRLRGDEVEQAYRDAQEVLE